MENKKNKTVRSRMTLLFILLTLIPILLLSTVSYFQRVRSVRMDALEKLTSIRDLKVQQLKSWYSEQHRDIRAISTLPDLRSLESSNISRNNFKNDALIRNAQEILDENNTIHPNIYNLYFVNSDNNIIVLSTNTTTLDTEFFDQNMYDNIVANNGHFHSAMYYSEVEQRNVLTFSSPVKCNIHNREHLIGYLICNIDLEFDFYPLLLNRVGLGETGETLLVDDNIISQSELRWYYDAPLHLKINAEPAKLAAAGSTGTIISKDYRGESIIAAYTYLPEQKWGFVCKQDLAELNSSARRLLFNQILIFILFSMIALGAAFLISRSITNPLVEIDNMVEKIRAGDYSARSNIKTNNEFGKLSTVINDMAQRTEERIFLRNSINELSASVLQATTIKEFGEIILKLLSKYTGAHAGGFFILNEDNSKYLPISSRGAEINELKPISYKYPNKTFKVAIKNQIPKLAIDIPKNCMFRNLDKNKNIIPREIYTLPIISELSTVALIGLANEIRFSEKSIRLLQLAESIISTAYSGLIARERSRIFSEQLFRINEQLQKQTEEIEKRAKDLNKQKLILEDTSKKLKNKNEELEIQKKVVERANQDLESFSYSVSHDLRAPLRAIKGFSDILIEEYSTKLGDEGTKVANVIVENTDKMSALIKDLLELSRVGRKSRNVSIVNMKEMANSMYHEVAEEKYMKKIDLKIDNIPKIDGDPNLLRQVWANLISNAIKFSSKRKKIKIHISSKDEKSRVIYSVKDNGAGFNMEYNEKLFGVFQRLHTEEEFSGTGVGLAIVKQIINKHNGEVWAESKINEGSTFYFSLPK